MSEIDITIKEIARLALAHTPWRYTIGELLDVSEEELEKVAQVLNHELKGESK